MKIKLRMGAGGAAGGVIVLGVAAVGVVVVRGATVEIDVVDQCAHHRGVGDAKAVESLPDHPLADLMKPDDPDDPVRQLGKGNGIGHGTDRGCIHDDAVVLGTGFRQQFGKGGAGKKGMGQATRFLGHNDIQIWHEGFLDKVFQRVPLGEDVVQTDLLVEAEVPTKAGTAEIGVDEEGF